jgi:hypothetical protein
MIYKQMTNIYIPIVTNKNTLFNIATDHSTFIDDLAIEPS